MVGAQILSTEESGNGTLYECSGWSTSTSLTSAFAVFIPQRATRASPVPALVFLAGLTGDQRRAIDQTPILNAAAEESLAIIFPDTSPRGANVEGEDDDYRVGLSAGWYVNAEVSKWRKHYRMYDLVLYDLLGWMNALNLDAIDSSRVSIMGESMGDHTRKRARRGVPKRGLTPGHGALVLYLRNRQRFKSASALAPVCNPARANVGSGAFRQLLGPGEPNDPPSSWMEYDSCHLLSDLGTDSEALNILIDVGTEDHLLLAGELGIDQFERVARSNGRSSDQVQLDYNTGFDHSYIFVSAFIDKHVKYHAECLRCRI